MPPARFTRLAPALFLLPAVALVAGCDSRPGQATPVEGVVTLDGTPLAKVVVQFMPEQAGMPGSTAVTDDDGRFVLRTADDRAGAIVGKHRVVVQGERADERSGSKGSPRVVPARYAAGGADNPLGVVEVTADKATGYDLTLKSK